MQKLPLKKELETKKILKKSIEANRALAHLNGVSKIIPNQNILINSLILQEAKDSSEIENIITSHDELYLANVTNENLSKEVKEVKNYKEALLFGYKTVKEKKILTLSDIVEIQKILVANDAGVRRQSGTILKNEATGETIYTPPQSYDEVMELLQNLTKYINDDTLEDYEYLIKMAIIHYQFESIHPFYDGNGRTGRILNVLYLVLKDLLDLPILYLSRYIIKNKSKYYQLLQEVRVENSWDNWINFMLEAVINTSKETTVLVKNIEKLMIKTKKRLKDELPKIYSKDLVEVLFLHPYTKIEFLVDRLEVTRKTASKYLKEIEKIGILKEIKMGRSIYFVNLELFDMLKKAVNS